METKNEENTLGKPQASLENYCDGNRHERGDFQSVRHHGRGGLDERSTPLVFIWAITAFAMFTSMPLALAMMLRTVK